MTEQNYTKRNWSFLLPGGTPSKKQLLEMSALKAAMQEVGLDIDGKELDSEENLRDYVMDKLVPGDAVIDLLKKLMENNNINYNPDGFKRLTKKGYLELFFVLFALEPDSQVEALIQGLTAAEADPPQVREQPFQSVTQEQAEPLTLATMNKIYQRRKKIEISPDRISYTEFTITNQIPVRLQDGFALRLRDKSLSVDRERAALVNTQSGQTVAVGHLEGEAQAPRLVFTANDIDYEAIRKNRNHKIVLFPAADIGTVVYTVECTVGYRDLEETPRTLCIDFGTSNTTVGSYGILNELENQLEIVGFPDMQGESKPMLPTLVYVDSCTPGQPVRYAFGYEAKKRIIADHFESKATVFHEIKSWINDLERQEEIFDAQGNKSLVKRKDIVKAYLKQVIVLAEQHFCKHFKYLHFSAPVKLKDSFLAKMREMFPRPEYVVLDDSSSLDEGIAVVYNEISDKIRDMDAGQDNAKTVFVIDCGGGTTDLAKCSVWREDAKFGQGKNILHVDTSFENGDSAYGGNNITYRILQLLKIKIDAFLQRKQNLDILGILAVNEVDILTRMDWKGYLLEEKQKLYANFEQAYQDAEKRIPTRYADTNDSFDKHCMLRNYNYLWQMAEAIKIEFYKSSNTVSVDFSKEEDRNICICGQEDYYLYVREDEQASLEKRTAPLGDIEITIKEINRIIYPDIYALLSVLFNEEYDNHTLQDVDRFKASGQSCNISLFHDLMKEFVPGRVIRPAAGSYDEAGRADKLKLSCLQGCIRYLMDKEYSQIKPVINMADPKMLYRVYAVNNKSEKQLLLGNFRESLKDGSKEGQYQYPLYHCFLNARRCRFVVEDAYGQQKNVVDYEFELDRSKRQEVNLEDSSDNSFRGMLRKDTYWDEAVLDILSNTLHNIRVENKNDNEYCIFLLPSKNGYGFCIYQMRVSYDNNAVKYHLVDKQTNGLTTGEYHSFEKMASFFDGKR